MFIFTSPSIIWSLYTSGTPFPANQVGRRFIAWGAILADGTVIWTAYIRQVLRNIGMLYDLASIPAGSMFLGLLAITSGLLRKRSVLLARLIALYLVTYFSALAFYQGYFYDVHGLRYLNLPGHLLSILIAAFCVDFFSTTAGISRTLVRDALMMGIIFLLLLSSAYQYWHMTQQYDWMRGHIIPFYTEGEIDRMFWPITDWISENLAEGTGVAVKDHGKIAYFTDIRVVDLAGIIDPSVITHLREGTMRTYLEKKEVEYVIVRSRGGQVFDAIREAASDFEKVPGFPGLLYRVSFSPPCGISISFDSAFYDVEAHDDHWWSWMRDDGQVSLENPWKHNAKVDVNFTGWALARERTLQIFQNGELLAELIVPVEPAEFSLPDVTLEPGRNTFIFSTYPRAEVIDSILHNGDSRDVSIALSDVTLNRCRYTRLPSTAQPLEADFGGRVKLLGYETSSEDGRIAPRGRLGVTLYWQSLAEIDKDYTIFVHLVDQAGRIYSQQDCQPQEGDYPTSLWRRGDVVWDAHELPIPSDTPAGSYRLMVGMYLLETMERLPVMDKGGERLQDDMIPLGEVQVM